MALGTAALNHIIYPGQSHKHRPTAVQSLSLWSGSGSVSWFQQWLAEVPSSHLKVGMMTLPSPNTWENSKNWCLTQGKCSREDYSIIINIVSLLWARFQSTQGKNTWSLMLVWISNWKSLVDKTWEEIKFFLMNTGHVREKITCNISPLVTEDGAWSSKHIGHRASFPEQHPLGPCTSAVWHPLSELSISQFTVPHAHLPFLARPRTRPGGKSHTLQVHLCPAQGFPCCSFTTGWLEAFNWISRAYTSAGLAIEWESWTHESELQALEAINRDRGGQSQSRIKS